jgi:Domain of unknown function (DUF4291)
MTYGAMQPQSYLSQAARWPTQGEHILATYDATSIVVYQAYRPSIARFALQYGQLGGPDFSFDRMSWIKPSFMWMMYRSGWATKEGQEMVLALRLARTFFDELLRSAVPSSFEASDCPDRAAWQAAVAASDVRRQWDPDHDPAGAKLERRAIQLGLRGAAIRQLATVELLEVIDMTPMVTEQRAHARGDFALLQSPLEHVYVPGQANMT